MDPHRKDILKMKQWRINQQWMVLKEMRRWMYTESPSNQVEKDYQMLLRVQMILGLRISNRLLKHIGYFGGAGQEMNLTDTNMKINIENNLEAIFIKPSIFCVYIKMACLRECEHMGVCAVACAHVWVWRGERFDITWLPQSLYT